MKDYEADIQEINDTLKKMQEDIDWLKNNFPYYSINEYGPVANNLLSTQAFNPEYETR